MSGDGVLDLPCEFDYLAKPHVRMIGIERVMANVVDEPVVSQDALHRCASCRQGEEADEASMVNGVESGAVLHQLGRQASLGVTGPDALWQRSRLAVLADPPLSQYRMQRVRCGAHKGRVEVR